MPGRGSGIERATAAEAAAGLGVSLPTDRKLNFGEGGSGRGEKAGKPRHPLAPTLATKDRSQRAEVRRRIKRARVSARDKPETPRSAIQSEGGMAGTCVNARQSARKIYSETEAPKNEYSLKAWAEPHCSGTAARRDQ